MLNVINVCCHHFNAHQFFLLVFLFFAIFSLISIDQFNATVSQFVRVNAINGRHNEGWKQDARKLIRFRMEKKNQWIVRDFYVSIQFADRIEKKKKKNRIEN